MNIIITYIHLQNLIRFTFYQIHICLCIQRPLFCNIAESGFLRFTDLTWSDSRRAVSGGSLTWPTPRKTTVTAPSSGHPSWWLMVTHVHWKPCGLVLFPSLNFSHTLSKFTLVKHANLNYMYIGVTVFQYFV